MTVEAPNIDGKHDDLSDALVRMVWLASQNLGRGVHMATGKGRGAKAQTGESAYKLRRRKALLSGSHESRQIPRKGRRR